ncbi:MAG: hypothetical protein AB8H80_17895 [Planctomycetota bacterium]
MLAIALAEGCANGDREASATQGSGVASSAQSEAQKALRIALAEHTGASQLDEQIRAAQTLARTKPDSSRLEALARCYIAKARASSDPGYYRLAEAAADAMPLPDQPAALLIRGHVRHALHDFAKAESITRRLVEQRGMFLDHGLLGDVLLDRGQFDEAQECYQRMLDLKPCLQSYARAAELRWRRGDVEGSLQLLELATHAGSRRAPESLAWAFSRQGALALHAGRPDDAIRHADSALEHVDDYAAALAVRGRAKLALGNSGPAAEDLATAVAQSPLPAHLWAFADALRAAGRDDEARATERTLRQTGAREDPRTFAVWLASQTGDAASGRDAELALRLAKREFDLRQDFLTSDALAWAYLRNGDLQQALLAMDQALCRGTCDARVRLHAAAICAASGDRTGAQKHGDIALAAKTALLPSERTRLKSLLAAL